MGYRAIGDIFRGCYEGLGPGVGLAFISPASRKPRARTAVKPPVVQPGVAKDGDNCRVGLRHCRVVRVRFDV